MGIFQFLYVEFDVLVGCSGEVQIGVVGVASTWLSPPGSRELWNECSVSARV